MSRIMRVLGIESSCDETGVALYDTSLGLLSHAIHSQVDMHQAYGGVVPELASRDHIRRLVPLLRHVLVTANANLESLDAIAYTAGPGLAGALLVGASFAAALAFARGIPALPVHHLEGHLLSPLLARDPPQFPFVALLVSGGHTQLMRVAAVGDYTLLGESLDDAAGEAFDKTAKLLGLGYPGGPALAQLATSGRLGCCQLPRPMLHSGDLDFSFSGLKTAVLTLVRNTKLSESMRADLAAEWRDYAQAPEEPNVTVLAAQMIRPWRAPQWLVEPVGDASDQDDLDAIWLAGYGVLSRDVRGWGEYNAIIAVAGTHYLAQLA